MNSYNKGVHYLVGMRRRGFDIISTMPAPPYRITPHLDRFYPAGEPLPCIYDAARRSWRVLIRVGNSFAPLMVAVKGEGQAPQIQVFVEEGAPQALKKELQSRASWVLATDVNYMEFLNRTQGTPLQQLAWHGFGLRPARVLGTYEALLLSAVWGQERPSAALASLVRKHGPSKDVEGMEFFGPPEPDAVLALGVDGLMDLGFSQVKAEVVIGIASAARSNSLPSLDDASNNPRKAVRDFQGIKGIGRGIAETAASLISKRPWGGVSPESAVKRALDLVGSRGDVDAVLSRLGDYAGLAYYLAEHWSANSN